MDKYYIGHIDNPDFFVLAVRADRRMSAPISWTTDNTLAMVLEEEEAEAVLRFISDVIDFEFAENLALRPAEDE